METEEGGGYIFKEKLVNFISILQGEMETGEGGGRGVHFQRKITQFY